MTCTEARDLMHQALDGCEEARRRLEAHLAECPECRDEFEALQRAQDVVAEMVASEPPEDRLERAMVAALAVADHRQHTRSPWAALAMAAAVLVAFGVGLLAGRAVWPREVVRMERVPQIVEKVVEREVPVVEERVVVKRVPVVRERIVYRDRPAKATEAEEQPPAAPPEPVMPEIREERIVAKPMPITITQTEEVAPAPVVDEETPEADEIGGEPRAPEEQRLALETSASKGGRIVQ